MSTKALMFGDVMFKANESFSCSQESKMYLWKKSKLTSEYIDKDIVGIWKVNRLTFAAGMLAIGRVDSQTEGT